jgi:NADPH2 dehydrogenase
MTNPRVVCLLRAQYLNPVSPRVKGMAWQISAENIGAGIISAWKALDQMHRIELPMTATWFKYFEVAGRIRLSIIQHSCQRVLTHSPSIKFSLQMSVHTSSLPPNFTMATLFAPLKVGEIELQHRVVMAPTTRFRADENHVPLPIMAEYYGQRAAVPGTLLFTEATYISPRASGYANAPAIYSPTQIEGWKRVTDAVHSKGSHIFVQLWAMGRAANPKILEAEGSGNLTGPSALPMAADAPIPRALTEDEVHIYIKEYVQAAQNAIYAGFDGVEIHAANGYLIHQFLEETSNQRTDGWGGDVAKRSRFLLEVTKAVTKEIGSHRVGVRLSPWNLFQGMCQTDPVPQYSHAVRALRGLDLAYLSLIESRINGIDDSVATGSLDFLIEIWGKSSAILLCGGFTAQNAAQVVEKEAGRADVAVMFARLFTSNPDLAFRLKYGIMLNPFQRKYFYNVGEILGYTDEPFSREFLEHRERAY